MIIVYFFHYNLFAFHEREYSFYDLKLLHTEHPHTSNIHEFLNDIKYPHHIFDRLVTTISVYFLIVPDFMMLDILIILSF